MPVKAELALTKEERATQAAGSALTQHGTIQAALMAACDAVGIHDSYLTADKLRNRIGWKETKMKHYRNAKRIGKLVSCE